MKRKVVGVWAELSAKQNQEVELSEVQKVELNKIQEMKSIANEVSNLPNFLDWGGDLDRISGMLQEMQREVRRAVTDARSLQKEYDSVYSSIEAAAKELGIDASELGATSMELEYDLSERLEIYEEFDKEIPVVVKAVNRLIV